ncbi:MAG: hypothetical protein ACJAY5_000932 [Actinomycetes bacterium]
MGSANHSLDIVLAKDSLDRKRIWGVHPKHPRDSLFNTQQSTAELIIWRGTHDLSADQANLASRTDFDDSEATAS